MNNWMVYPTGDIPPLKRSTAGILNMVKAPIPTPTPCFVKDLEL